MTLPVTAADEILKVIKRLDQEEAHLRKTAARCLVQSTEAERASELVAAKRRQYEYALSALTDDKPVPAAAPHKAKPSNVIFELGASV